MNKAFVSLTIGLCLAAGCSPGNGDEDGDDRDDVDDVDPLGNEGEGEGENGLGETPVVHPRRESRWQHEVDGTVVDELLAMSPHQPLGAGLVDGVATILSVMVVDEVWTGSLQLLQDPLGAATTIEMAVDLRSDLNLIFWPRLFSSASPTWGRRGRPGRRQQCGRRTCRR